jgi:hypothetical protein
LWSDYQISHLHDKIKLIVDRWVRGAFSEHFRWRVSALPPATSASRWAIPCKAKSYQEILAMNNKPNNRISGMKFADVYPLYIQKAERKNRTKEEVDQIICWLTGYNQAGLQQRIKQGNDFETFFAQAPAMNPNRSLINGVVCGVRVEEIEDPLMQNIRYLDKLIDELAKGKAMEKILRQEEV